MPVYNYGKFVKWCQNHSIKSEFTHQQIKGPIAKNDSDISSDKKLFMFIFVLQ